MIRLMVIGNLGKDCIVNNVNGKSVINFSVAHTEKFKDSTGTQKEKTTWVECAYWTDKTGISPYLKRGQQVYVEGTPEVRTYQNNEGKSGASLSLRVQMVQLVGSRGENTGMQTQERNYGNSNSNNNGNSYSYSNQNSNTSSSSSAREEDLNEAGDDLPF